ncbi:MAG: RDD family protein [Actinomycetota bacterium]
MTPLSADRARGQDTRDGSDVARGTNGRAGSYYADGPNRLIGYLLDAIILAILAFAGAVIVSLVFGPVVTFDLAADPTVSVDAGLALADVVLATAISAAYFIFTWRRFGGSPGHRLLGMRIWGEDHERPVTIGQGVVRWSFIGLPLGVQAAMSVVVAGLADAVLSLTLLAWYLVLFVTTVRSPTKQGIHDRAAHTVVTKVAREAPWADAGWREPGADVH